MRPSVGKQTEAGTAGRKALLFSLIGHALLAIFLLVEFITVRQRDVDDSYIRVAFPRTPTRLRTKRRPPRLPKRSAASSAPSPIPPVTRRTFSSEAIPIHEAGHATSAPSVVQWEGPTVGATGSPPPVRQFRAVRSQMPVPIAVAPPAARVADHARVTHMRMGLPTSTVTAPRRRRRVARRDADVPQLSRIAATSAPGPGQKTMTGADIARVPGTTGDVLKALPLLPGIASPGELTGELYVRGGRPEENRFYFDRIPLAYPYHFGGLTSTINSETVDRIDVHAGGFGAQFGEAQAVIDIAPPARRRDGFRGSADVNLLLSEWYGQGPIGENGSAYVAGRRSYLDLIVSRFVSTEELTALPRFWDYQAGMELDLSDSQHLRLTTFAAEDFMQFFIDGDDVTDNPEYAGELRYRYGFYGRGGTLTSDFGDRGRLLSTLSQVGGGFDVAFGQGFFLRIDYDTHSLRQDLALSLSDRHTLEVGHESTTGHLGTAGFFALGPDEEDEEFDFFEEARRYEDAKERLTWLHGYVQDRMQLAEGLTLTLGGRFGYHNLTDDARLDPRVSVAYEWESGPTVRAAWGIYRQSPEPLQVLEDWGNPDVGSTRAGHYVLELERRFSDELLVKGAGYYKTLDDLVTSDPVAVYLNQGVGFARGLEVFAKYTPSDRVVAWLSYTYGLSKRRAAPGEELLLTGVDQTHVATVAFNVRPDEKWDIGVKRQYTTGLPQTPVIGARAVVETDGGVDYAPVYGARNSVRAPAFDRMDVRVARRFTLAGVPAEAYLEGLNATNRRNVMEIGYSEDYSEEEPVYQLPRIPFIGIVARF
ncbi:TonB-dependent receptor [Candidatus Poribacteria bacterium]|nr:TonB-dependent receptor [Candidatus Poribacteria bacterium]